MSERRATKRQAPPALGIKPEKLAAATPERFFQRGRRTLAGTDFTRRVWRFARWLARMQIGRLHVSGPRLRMLVLLSLAVLVPVAGQGQGATDLKVIARTGDVGLTTIRNSVSINNAGLVAFNGITATGRGSFAADATGPRAVRPINDNTAVGFHVQLNDAGILAASRGTFFFTQPPIYSGPILIVPGYSESYDFLQTWAADGSGALSLIAEGRSRTDAQTLQTNKVGPFASVGLRVTINNVGQVAFVADQGTGLINDYVLATAKVGGGFNTFPAYLGASPLLSDDGRIVARPGSTDSNPILLFNYDFTSSETVASSASGFSALGRMPGISDDGLYVAFTADLSSAGAAALGTTAGPGIFLSYRSSGVRTTKRLVGLTNTGSTVAFSAFDGDQRVGVNQQPTSGKVLVAFAGTNGAGVKGIWCAHFNPANTSDILLVKVILQSDQVDGMGPWDEFRLADPVNTLGQIACWARSGTQHAIVKAVPAVGLTLHRLNGDALVVTKDDGIDDPLQLTTNVEPLSNQPPLGLGLVADGVTPMLIKLTASPGTYQISFDVKGNPADKPLDLVSHLRVLADGKFNSSAQVVLSPTSPVGYACISGIQPEDLSFSDFPELIVTVKVATAGSELSSTTFRLRKPPVVLVHGYNTDGNSWSSAFKANIESFRSADFVIPINYGVSGKDTTVNTYGSLDSLTKVLDSVLRGKIEVLDDSPEPSLKRFWSFTRYDVVGHSQGGVLLRMLCTKDPAFSSESKFASPDNYYRGRFRRIVTIGSPHNGSLFLYYALKLSRSVNSVHQFVFFELKKRHLLQTKFDPFGNQIRLINHPKFKIDDRAKFRLYRSTIASGFGGCPPVYALTGLCDSTPGFIPRRQVLLPEGSDGVVDYQSQGGGADSRTGTFSEDLSHSDPTIVFFGPFLGNNQTQTGNSGAGFEVAAALEGNREFGPFYLPIRLPEEKRRKVDAIVPTVFLVDEIHAIFPAPSGSQRAAVAANAVTQFHFRVAPPEAEPIAGDVNWFVEVFGPDGVSSSGVTWQVDSGNSRNVTVAVDQSVVGDVVLYGGYDSSTDKLILSKPVVVISRPPGAALAGIELVPPTVTMSIGDKLEPEIWGVYNNGTRSRLFISIDRPASFSSSNETIVGADMNGSIAARSTGSGIVTATYNGFSSQIVVSTVPAAAGPNTPPVANDKTQHAPSVGVATTVYSATTDTSDADGDERTLSITVQPTHGTATTDGATVTYTSNGFAGSDVITLQANDGFGGTDLATITLTNTAPGTANDTAKVLAGAATMIDALANDSDADGDALRVDVVTQGTSGTVAISGNKKLIIYTPGPSFISGDMFTYTVKDDRGGSKEANIAVALGEVATFVLAGKGMQIPGEPPGTVFRTFGAPSITPGGATAFSGNYRTSTGKTKHGIFAGLPVRALVREGDSAPGTAFTFAGFADPVMNRNGMVAFKGTLANAPVASATGLWLANTTGPVLVIRQKDPVPRLGGALFGTLFDIALPDNGEVLFTASLLPGRGGIDKSNDFGLWRRKASGQLESVLRESDQVEDETATMRKVKTLAIFGSLTGTTGQRRGFNNAGDTVLRVTFTDGVSALLKVPATGTPEMLLRTAQPIVELGGARINTFSLPVLADDGGVTVLATLEVGTGGTVTANDTVLLHRQADGTLRLVARKGVALLESSGAVLKRLGDPVGGEQGALTFAGALKTARGGVLASTDTGLWESHGSDALHPLIREGDVAPGIGGGTFAGFQSLARSGNRGAAFTATLNLQAGLVTAGNENGLWTQNTDGDITLLLRKKDRINVGGAMKKLQSMTVLSAVLGSPSQGHSFNGNGGFAVRAAFTDGSQAILSVWVP